MSDEAKTREQLISELISLREEISRLKDLDITARRLNCSEQLAIGLAHNFNNILTPILGYSYLGAKASAGDANLPKYFDEISKAAEKAAELTNMLLAFSGRQIRYPRMINLNGFIVNMESIMKATVGDKVEIRMTLSRDLAAVKVDPKQVERVLRNLAANSRDAMPNGGRLTIETANVYLEDDQTGLYPNAAAGEHVMMVVSDTGVGMTDEVRRHVFEPFFSTYEPWDKIGMGLSVCYGIVFQSGGRIDVQSEPENGTVIKIYMPQSEQSPESTPVDDSSDITIGDAKTILLIEPDYAIADLASRALREHGYRVITASNVNAAVRDGKDNAADLVVTSIVRPIAGRDDLEGRLDSVIHVVDDGRYSYASTPIRFDPVPLMRKVREALEQK